MHYADAFSDGLVRNGQQHLSYETYFWAKSYHHSKVHIISPMKLRSDMILKQPMTAERGTSLATKQQPVVSLIFKHGTDPS